MNICTLVVQRTLPVWVECSRIAEEYNMQATIIKIHDRSLDVRVRRSRVATVYVPQGPDPRLRIGDRVDVERRVNDPYLRLI